MNREHSFEWLAQARTGRVRFNITPARTILAILAIRMTKRSQATLIKRKHYRKPHGADAAHGLECSEIRKRVCSLSSSSVAIHVAIMWVENAVKRTEQKNTTTNRASRQQYLTSHIAATPYLCRSGGAQPQGKAQEHATT